MMSRIRKLFQIQGYPVFIICLLLAGIGISITQPYLSLFCTEDFGMTTSAFGFFMAVSSLSGVIVNSLIAQRSDSGLDRKKLIIAAMISSAIAYVSYLVFHDFIILLIAVSFLNGIGAATMPQIYAYAQESANESKSEDKALALSSLRSLVSLGFLIGPLCGASIWGMSGYSGLFTGTSLIYVITTFVVLLFLKRMRTASRKKGKTSGLMSTLKDRKILLSMIAFVLLFAINAFNAINTPLFIINELHGTHAQVGLAVSL